MGTPPEPELLEAARRTIGVTGDDDVRPALTLVRESGVGLYPLIALALLVVTHDFRQSAVLVFAPEISDDLDVSRTAIGAIAALAALTGSVATLLVATLVQRTGRRAQVVLASAVLWCASTVLTGAVQAPWQLAAVAMLYALATASVVTLHAPLLMDAYPPALRARILSGYHAARSAANVVAPLLVAVLASALGLGWRRVLVVMGLVGLALTLPALRLRDPQPGRWDVEPVRDLVRPTVRTAPPAGAALRLVEIWQHLMSVPTVRRILYAHIGVGMTFIPLGTYLLFFLRDEWGLTPGQRSLFFALTPLGAIVALALFGPVAERLFRSDPRTLLRLCAGVFAGAVAAIAVAVLAPVFAVAALGITAGLAAIVMVGPGLQLVALSVVPPQMRPHYAAIAGVFLSGIGGFAGLLLLRSIDERLGVAPAIASLTVPALVAALVAARAGDTLQQDLDRLLIEILDDEQAAQRFDEEPPPLLECRRLVVSYDRTPVLNGVDISVEAGEAVALLGTNGAGKSTLLRCISGLRLPGSGTVRLRGRTITYLDAERRVAGGIVHLPGAGCTFAPLTVRQNLDIAARARGGRAQVEVALEVLPELVPLLDRPAAALSGGEQRLVGLARVVVLQPQLLLVDELSLGLAPALVTRSVELIRQLRDGGVGVLVVDQSVEVAARVATRAYLLADGVVAFAGAIDELRDRPELLGARFLSRAAPGAP